MSPDSINRQRSLCDIYAIYHQGKAREGATSINVRMPFPLTYFGAAPPTNKDGGDFGGEVATCGAREIFEIPTWLHGHIWKKSVTCV